MKDKKVVQPSASINSWGVMADIKYREHQILVETILREKNAEIATLTKRVAELEKALRWWEEPFDQETFDEMKQQASRNDSLAANLIYIGHLERALKQLEVALKDEQQLHKECFDLLVKNEERAEAAEAALEESKGIINNLTVRWGMAERENADLKDNLEKSEVNRVELLDENHQLKARLREIAADSGNRPGHEEWQYYCKRLFDIHIRATQPTVQSQSAGKEYDTARPPGGLE